jgi:hypothetical protein
MALSWINVVLLCYFLNTTTVWSFQSLNNSPTYAKAPNKFNTKLAESILNDPIKENSELQRNKVRKEKRMTRPNIKEKGSSISLSEL